MRQLVEQWVENGRMYKAVLPSLCDVCAFKIGEDKERGIICKHGKCVTTQGSVHDLGPVNEDGCLAEERTGLFPEIANKFDLFAMDRVWVAEFQYADSTGMIIQIQIRENTKKECIDAWNRRARCLLHRNNLKDYIV